MSFLPTFHFRVRTLRKIVSNDPLRIFSAGCISGGLLRDGAWRLWRRATKCCRRADVEAGSAGGGGHGPGGGSAAPSSSSAEAAAATTEAATTTATSSTAGAAAPPSSSGGDGGSFADSVSDDGSGDDDIRRAPDLVHAEVHAILGEGVAHAARQLGAAAATAAAETALERMTGSIKNI